MCAPIELSLALGKRPAFALEQMRTDYPDDWDEVATRLVWNGLAAICWRKDYGFSLVLTDQAVAQLREKLGGGRQ